jgi:hypothetical protein
LSSGILKIVSLEIESRKLARCCLKQTVPSPSGHFDAANLSALLYTPQVGIMNAIWIRETMAKATRKNLIKPFPCMTSNFFDCENWGTAVQHPLAALF